MFPILWPISIILYFSNRGDSYVKWICLLLFIGGGGSYFALMHNFFQPHLQSKALLSSQEYAILSVSVTVFMAMFYFLLPYVFLMSSIALAKGKIPFLKWLLLLPSVIFFLMDFETIMTGITLNRLHIWAVLYILTGCFLYLFSIFNAENQEQRRNTIRLCILFIPILSVILLKDFLFIDQVILSEKDIIFIKNTDWTINSNFIDLWLIILLFFYSIRYGILGIKLRLEKHRLSATMSTLSSGTTIINHAIKNEIQKMDYMLERTRSHILEENKDDAIQSVEKIGFVTGHLQQMMDRIKEKSQEIILTEKTVNLTELLDTVLDGFQPLLEQKNISLMKEYELGVILRCDAHHIYEVFSNLCTNAIDSIQAESGILTVKVKRLKKHIAVEVSDTGCGMDKNSISKIFEPFFTTKNNTRNYGLGLSYCYNVMGKHQGQIKVLDSKKDIGTTMSLLFPKRRMIEVNQVMKRGQPNGKNQSLTGGR
ncbi:sensor histidine kinase [Neobacillus sp. SAB-20_R2A]|uniref:sensor histidine kinase n=1 Tax=Neobacillus sp. SAB-20_R2A TaxID=3120519 RepID=UPI003C6E324D